MSRSRARTDRLEAAIAAARALQVRPDVAERRAEEIVRLARATEPRRSWTWALAAPVAAAAVLAAVLWGSSSRSSPSGSVATTPQLDVVEVGPRVALVARPGTRYAVLESSTDRTEIAVELGAVTARLDPGAQPHELALSGRGLRAVATGTTYSLVVPPAGAADAVVHEGAVTVTHAGTSRTIAAGTSYSGADAAAFAADARRLDGHRRTAPAASLAPTVSDDAAAGAPRPAARRTTPAAPTPAAATPAERWRHARALQGAGRLAEALDELRSIADGGDPTWRPIAQVEMMRLHAASSRPRAVVELGARFLRAHPGHDLAADALRLYCPAHRQLGTTPLPAACAPGRRLHR